MQGARHASARLCQPKDELLPERDCRLLRNKETTDDAHCSLHIRYDNHTRQRCEARKCVENAWPHLNPNDPALRPRDERQPRQRDG